MPHCRERKLPRLVLEFKTEADRTEFFTKLIGPAVKELVEGRKSDPAAAWKLVEVWGLGEGDA